MKHGSIISVKCSACVHRIVLELDCLRGPPEASSSPTAHCYRQYYGEEGLSALLVAFSSENRSLCAAAFHRGSVCLSDDCLLLDVGDDY